MVSNNKIELLDLQLNTEENGYFLSAKYRIEDDNSIRELDIPRIKLPVYTNSMNIVSDNHYGNPEVSVDIGFGYCRLWRDCSREFPVYYTETVIEEKTHEMTLDEIEQKLGYKVKIVNKKGK